MSRLLMGPAGTTWFPADPAAVHDRDVGAEPGAHHVGDEVAHVRLARAEGGVPRVERHPALADPHVERRAEASLVALDQRGHRGILGQIRRDRDEPVLAGQHLPVPGRLEVDAHDEHAVRPRLGDQRVADHGLQRVVLVAADDQVDPGHLTRHPLVGRHVLMSDRDHDRPAAGPELGDRRPRGGDRVAELDPRPRARRLRRVGDGQPEVDPLDAVALDHVRRARAAERKAGAPVQHVAGHPGEARFLHPREQRRRAEVELVVAERGDVEAELVPGGDHLLAPEHRRHDRRRDGVPGQGEQRVRRLLARPRDQGRDPRHPALLPARGPPAPGRSGR